MFSILFTISNCIYFCEDGTPGNVFDCQSARRVLEELHNDSRNLAASSGIQRREGIEKSGSDKTIATNAFTLLFSGNAKEKQSGRQIQRSLFCGKLANEIERLGGTRYKILRTHLVRNSNSGKKRAMSRRYPKKVNLMSEILARRRLRNENLRKPHDKKSAPAKQQGIWRGIYFSSRPRTKLRLFSCENTGCFVG